MTSSLIDTRVVKFDFFEDMIDDLMDVRVGMGVLLMGLPCVLSVCLAIILFQRELRKMKWMPRSKESMRRIA